MIMTLGSGSLKANVPEDFPCFFADGIPVHRRHGTPHELDIYALYLGLRALECREDCDYSDLRAQIVKGVLARREICDGFWYHSHWPGSHVGSGLRSTSAAIRLLVEAHFDGLIDDEDQIVSSLHKHLSFGERLDDGSLWFYHDSFESSVRSSVSPFKSFKNRVWGSSEGNTLILNSHIDTLRTILHVLTWVDALRDADRRSFTAKLYSGLAALQHVLVPRNGPACSLFQCTDSFVRRQIFNSYDQASSAVGKVWVKLWRQYYSRLRPHLKARFPSFQFKDGYLERDISLSGMAFRYHVVNTWDLARLALQLEAHRIDIDLAVKSREMARKGLEYAFSPSYLEFVEHCCRKGQGFGIRLCEALFTFFQREQLLNDTWIRRYVTIRRCLPPTPALLGYDPIVIDRSLIRDTRIIAEFELDIQSTDVLILSKGRYLIVNFGDYDTVLPDYMSHPYTAVWLSDRACVAESRITLGPHSAVMLQKH